MPFITTTPPSAAEGEVLAMYQRQQDSWGFVPNYAKVFCHRPDVMKLWADLLYGIKRNMDRRRFELVTVSVALSIRSSYCSLAHGKALTQFFAADEVRAIVEESDDAPLTEAEKAMMLFAREITRDANAITAEDVDALKSHGLDDAEIFDIAAAATARTFFARLCEGLGATPDVSFQQIDPALRQVLTVGRPIDAAATESVG